jgi:hypothetical protein
MIEEAVDYVVFMMQSVHGDEENLFSFHLIPH